MSQIILIRHAQASLGKINYDELSSLGFKQAAILGQYLKEYALEPASIITGSLVRHKQTANEISKAFPSTINLVQNEDWNEFDFKKLIQLYLSKYPKDMPAAGDIRAFFSILKKSMLAWSEDELDFKNGAFESWNEFSARISRAISNIAIDSDKPTFIVSSGGAIAMLLMKILETKPKSMIDMNFQIRNTSFTELLHKPHKTNLVAFNQINHLIETRDNSMITYA
jgi:broad specificity phosphatase PhoE